MAVSETDPTIAVLLEHVPEGAPGRAQGWHGRCTDCGPAWTMHRWHTERALLDAAHHIDVTHR